MEKIAVFLDEAERHIDGGAAEGHFESMGSQAADERAGNAEGLGKLTVVEKARIVPVDDGDEIRFGGTRGTSDWSG